MKYQLVGSSIDPSRAYLLLPGLDETLLEGVEFRLNQSRGTLDVFLYEQGFDDGDDVNGVRIPVPINEDSAPVVNRLTELVVLNPNTDSLTELPEEQQLELCKNSDWLPEQPPADPDPTAG